MLVGALALMMMLTGCGTLSSSLVARVPTNGPIQQGEQVGTDSEDQFIRVIARGPREGMTPADTVQGFLDASASFDGDHAVARQYLTPQANEVWDSTEGVAVYEGVGSLSGYGGTVTLTASQSGRISSIGRYEVAAAGSNLRADFALTRVDGEWRINRAPQGLILSAADVDRSFRSLSVYFFEPTFTTLVPDARMVPVLGPGQATTLVRYLIAGPSSWLLPAVRTGFPDGVDLTIDSVPVIAGVANVDLTMNARVSEDTARRALSQQLVWTLRQLPDITAVNITAGGQPLVVPGIASPQSRDSWPEVDPAALPQGSSGYIARVDSIGRLDGDEVTPVRGAIDGGETSFVDIAVSRNSDTISGLDGQGDLWRGRLEEGWPMIKILAGASLSNPVFDRTGAVWVVDADSGLSVVGADAVLTQIPITDLPERTSVTMAVPSRDGTRVALVVRRGPRTSLLVGRVVRTSPSGQFAISLPIRVESRLTDVVDVGWSGADSIAVLGSVEAGTLQVFDVDLARGSVASLGAPEAPVSIAAAPGLPMLVGAADGRVYALSAGSWRDKANGTAPAYPN